MKILIKADIFTAGHEILHEGTAVDLPMVEAHALLVAGRAAPNGPEAQAELEAHNLKLLNQAQRLILGRPRAGGR